MRGRSIVTVQQWVPVHNGQVTAYMGNGLFIHAVEAVVVERLPRPPYRPDRQGD